MSSMFGPQFALGVDPEADPPLSNGSLDGETAWTHISTHQVIIGLPWANTIVVIHTPNAQVLEQIRGRLYAPKPTAKLVTPASVTKIFLQSLAGHDSVGGPTRNAKVTNPQSIRMITADLQALVARITPSTDCPSNWGDTTIVMTLSNAHGASRTYWLDYAPCGRVTDGHAAALRGTPQLFNDAERLIPDSGLPSR